jgi:glycosyltransferase involved in cell wall biosynthesis
MPISGELEVSVVMPCLNEENSVGICVRKAKEVFAREGIRGEIIVADNGSTDCSCVVAEKAGAKVVVESQPGYGAAYLRGLEEAQGKFIVIADSDNSYNFYDIPRFLQPLRDGYDFVIGSRFRGKMAQGAMPWLNRYVGNPILSGAFRVFFRARLTDALCGMRALTAAAYRRMKLRTLGMEFATEMIFSALQNNLRIREIPVDYHLRAGRSKLRPFADAWRYIRFMLLYCPSWLYFIPGLSGFLLGMALQLLLLRGPFYFLGRLWNTHLMVLAGGMSILSYQLLNLGVYAHTFAINQGFLKKGRIVRFVERHFSLERGIFLGAILIICGFFLNLFIFLEWFSRSFGPLFRIRESIFAVNLLIIGLQTVFSSFFISLLFLKRR